MEPMCDRLHSVAGLCRLHHGQTFIDKCVVLFRLEARERFLGPV
jgi:hypothetical protein